MTMSKNLPSNAHEAAIIALSALPASPSQPPAALATHSLCRFARWARKGSGQVRNNKRPRGREGTQRKPPWRSCRLNLCQSEVSVGQQRWPSLPACCMMDVSPAGASSKAEARLFYAWGLTTLLEHVRSPRGFKATRHPEGDVRVTEPPCMGTCKPTSSVERYRSTSGGNGRVEANELTMVWLTCLGMCSGFLSATGRDEPHGAR